MVACTLGHSAWYCTLWVSFCIESLPDATALVSVIELEHLRVVMIEEMCQSEPSRLSL